MKRKASLLLVLVFVLALLSGCGGAKTGGNEQPSTEVTASASAEPAQSTEPAQSAEPTQSQYRFAAGKYETDAAGWPTGSFTYEEPFCYTDEVFTLWTSNFTPYLLPEDGPEGIDFNQEEQRRTGVDIEYIIISSETRGENFAALLAADDLPDIMANADGYYNGSMLKGIAEGYFLNIYDYKQYAPNYFYFIRSNMEDDPYVYDKSFQNETTVGSFVAFDTTPGMTLSPVAIRNDWLRKLNYDIDKLRTLDKLTEVGKAFQVNSATTSTSASCP
jgi:putative aldouronate transport system substrate-binding protein